MKRDVDYIISAKSGHLETFAEHLDGAIVLQGLDESEAKFVLPARREFLHL